MFIYFSISFLAYGKNNIWIIFSENPTKSNFEPCQEQLLDSIAGEQSGRYKHFKSPTYLDLTAPFQFESHQGKVSSKFFILIANGNAYASELGFQLYPIFRNNPEVTEFLNIYLGQLIRRNPTMFLKLLKKHRNNISDISLGGLLGNYGGEFVDKPEKMLNETEKRIIALKSVKNENLITLRDRCLRNMTEHKEELLEVIEWIKAGSPDPEPDFTEDPSI
jgi:hypothetical protein